MLFTDFGRKFKFQAQDSFSDFFLRFGDEKNETHFLKKKPPLRAYCPNINTMILTLSDNRNFYGTILQILISQLDN